MDTDGEIKPPEFCFVVEKSVSDMSPEEENIRFGEWLIWVGKEWPHASIEERVARARSALEAVKRGCTPEQAASVALKIAKAAEPFSDPDNASFTRISGRDSKAPAEETEAEPRASRATAEEGPNQPAPVQSSFVRKYEKLARKWDNNLKEHRALNCIFLVSLCWIIAGQLFASAYKLEPLSAFCEIALPIWALLSVIFLIVLMIVGPK